MVEIGPEPLFGAAAAEQFIDESLKIFGHMVFVIDLIVRLAEIEAVVEGGGGKLHPHLVAELVQGHQILTVHILHGHAEAHIRVSHFHQGFQGLIAPVPAVRQTPDGVVGIFQSLNADADAQLGEFFAQFDDPVALFIQLLYDLGQILADKGLAAGDIGKSHLRQLFDHVHLDLILRPGGVFPAVAHIAFCVAPVGDNHRSV